MANKSKLSDLQWDELLRRHIVDGVDLKILAKEAKVTVKYIHERIKGPATEVKDVANQMLSLNKKLGSLTISRQLIVHDLASLMRSISTHLANAANNGAATSSRLSNFAHNYSELIDPIGDAKINQQVLSEIAAYQSVANECSKVGLNLLAANKDSKPPPPDPSADLIPDDPIEASRAYQRLTNGT
jgi:hypothetical protein